MFVFSPAGNAQLIAELQRTLFDAAQAHGYLVKSAGTPESSPSLAGRLYASSSGWILLAVPNAVVNGLFSALDEPGIELPPTHGKAFYDAHISVMRKEEVEGLGGVDRISERGRMFHYQLGPIKTVRPAGWDEMSKVWFVEVKSPELEKLRKTYGLEPLPNGYQFHITVAVRRKHVLGANPVSKAAADLGWLAAVANYR